MYRILVLLGARSYNEQVHDPAHKLTRSCKISCTSVAIFGTILIHLNIITCLTSKNFLPSQHDTKAMGQQVHATKTTGNKYVQLLGQ